MPKYNLTMQELKLILKQEGIKVRPSYCHDDYMLTSFSMPYPLKDKLDNISKRYGLTRSKVVQLLLESVNSNTFIEDIIKNRKLENE